MAVTQVMWIQAETYQALDARLAESAVFGPPTTTLARPGGVIPGYGGDLAVTAPGGTASVNVAPGAALIAAATSSQGNYRLINDATVTKTIAAYSGQNRTDLILAQVTDTGTASTSLGDITVVAGTAGAGVPAMPAGINAVKLAEVTMTSTGVIASGNIADKRTYAVAVGGVHRCTSTTRPGNPFDGMTCYETDTFNYATWSTSGNQWRLTPTGATGAWTAYTPTWTASTSNPVNGANGTLAGAYLKSGKTVFFRVTLVVSGVGLVVGTGNYAISLPSGLAATSAPSTAKWMVNAYWFDATGATVSLQHWVGVGHIAAGATTVTPIYLACGDPTSTTVKGGIWGAAVPTAPASTDNLYLTGCYETT